MCAMSFVPTDEQKMLVEAINKYAVNEARKAAHEADESGRLPDSSASCAALRASLTAYLLIASTSIFCSSVGTNDIAHINILLLSLNASNLIIPHLVVGFRYHLSIT